MALILQGASMTDLAVDIIRQLGLAENREERPSAVGSGRNNAPRPDSALPIGGRCGARGEKKSVTSSNAIAVIGMAGRFPGARSVLEFWRNLRGGVESIVDLSDEDLIGAGVGEKALAHRSYVRRAALLPGLEEFDADFFGFTPNAARMLDPQHRLFLQTAWHAMEDAGFDPAENDKSVGVFGTSSSSGYLLHNIMSHYDPHMVIGQGASFDMVNLSLQTDKDHLATRSPTSSTCAGRRCRSRRPAHHHWSPCTWPARASLTASARWHWPAARRCGCHTGSATGMNRVPWFHRPGTAARSTSVRTEPFSAVGWASSSSSRCRTPSTTATGSMP